MALFGETIGILIDIVVICALGFLVGFQIRHWAGKKDVGKLARFHVKWEVCEIETLWKRLRDPKPTEVPPCQTVRDIRVKAATELSALDAEIKTAEANLPREPYNAVLAGVINLNSRLARVKTLLEAADEHVEPLVGRVRVAATEAIAAFEPLLAELASSRVATGKDCDRSAELLRDFRQTAEMAKQAPVKALRRATELLKEAEKLYHRG